MQLQQEKDPGMDRGMNKVIYYVCMLIAIVVLILTVKSCEDCQAKGGELVRGIFWYRCID